MTPQQRRQQPISNVIITTNYDTLSIPIKFDICKDNYHHSSHSPHSIPSTHHHLDKDKDKRPNHNDNHKQKPSVVKNSKRSRNNNKKNHYFPNVDFNILTRPNMSKRLPIKFRNPWKRPILITNLELNKRLKGNKYMKIEKNFNKTYLVLPDKTVELGHMILIAIPNINGKGKPIKTNIKLNGSIEITILNELPKKFDEIAKNKILPLYSNLNNYDGDNEQNNICKTCNIKTSTPTNLISYKYTLSSFLVNIMLGSIPNWGIEK